MACCYQAPSHHLNQCCPKCTSPYDVTRPQCVNILRPRSRHFENILFVFSQQKSLYFDVNLTDFFPYGPTDNSQHYLQVMTWYQTYESSSSSDISLIKSLIYFLIHHSACFWRPCWWHGWAVVLTFMSILEENSPYPYHKVINSLGPSNAIWWHRSGSTWAQVMACCLMAPSHYLNQCWLIISKVQLHSSEGTFIPGISTSDHYLTWTLISSNLNQFFRSQWVNMYVCLQHWNTT